MYHLGRDRFHPESNANNKGRMKRVFNKLLIHCITNESLSALTMEQPPVSSGQYMTWHLSYKNACVQVEKYAMAALAYLEKEYIMKTYSRAKPTPTAKVAACDTRMVQLEKLKCFYFEGELKKFIKSLKTN